MCQFFFNFVYFSVQGFKALIGNGYCNDETNNAENRYDGGDCCGYDVNTKHCSICGCYHEETCAARVHPLVKDGNCNDETNIAVCNYDGGDCCGSCVIKKLCSECACLNNVDNDGYSTAIGNGFCNDETNNAKCNYDGGDCCGSCIVTQHCSECQCLGTVTGNGIPNPLVGNDHCNDETNNAVCDYDGGDCCVNTNREYCSDCSCFEGGTITSPGYPGNYENNLDLTWLINVSPNQLIQMTFLSFKVESGTNCK